MLTILAVVVSVVCVFIGFILLASSTMQYLSALFFVLGAAVLVWNNRRKKAKIEERRHRELIEATRQGRE